MTEKTDYIRVRRDLFQNRKAALTSGAGLLVMALVAGLAYGYLHGQLVVPGNATETAQNLQNRPGAFYSEVSLWGIIFLLDVAVAIGLYHFFKGLNRALSLTAMVFRLVYSLFLGTGTVLLATAAGMGNEALVRIELFEKVWSLGLIVFGAHLICLGLLALKKRAAPPVLAWLLLFSGLCYTVLHSLYNLGEEAAVLAAAAEPVLAAPMALAEMLLAVWLIVGVIRSRRSAP